MAKRRVKFATIIGDPSLEKNIFYYKKCKVTGTTLQPGDYLLSNHNNYDGARSDREDNDENKKPKEPRHMPPPTSPPRQVMKLECKICVTVCCSDDCECKEQPMTQSSSVLQLEHSECKTCVTTCCGDDCKCKEQLMPQSTTVVPESKKTTEKESEVFPTNVFTIETGKNPITNTFPGLEFHGTKKVTYEGPLKIITQNISLSGVGNGTLTQSFIKTATGFKLQSNSLNISRARNTRRDLNTRDYIKNVITHDGDINSILKDLVRVTLQKVDMMKKMDTRRNKVTEYTDVEDTESDF